MKHALLTAIMSSALIAPPFISSAFAHGDGNHSHEEESKPQQNKNEQCQPALENTQKKKKTNIKINTENIQKKRDNYIDSRHKWHN